MDIASDCDINPLEAGRLSVAVKCPLKSLSLHLFDCPSTLILLRKGSASHVEMAVQRPHYDQNFIAPLPEQLKRYPYSDTLTRLPYAISAQRLATGLWRLGTGCFSIRILKDHSRKKFQGLEKRTRKSSKHWVITSTATSKSKPRPDYDNDKGRRYCQKFYEKYENGDSVNENGDENGLRVESISIVRRSRRRYR